MYKTEHSFLFSSFSGFLLKEGTSVTSKRKSLDDLEGLKCFDWNIIQLNLEDMKRKASSNPLEEINYFQELR